MNVDEFWNQVRQRRRHFFLWWVSWPFVGLAAAIAFRSATGSEVPSGLMILLMVCWAAGWVAISRRLTRLKCPACQKPAIGTPYFFMRHARCQHCGLAYVGKA